MNVLLVLGEAINDPSVLGGYSGWAGAGLLGLVLAWLLFVHLPAKDKQIMAMLDVASQEREKERTSRHTIANLYQTALGQLTTEHKEDAEKDREAFLKRQERLEDGIKLQTAELKAAIASMANNLCKFSPNSPGR